MGPPEDTAHPDAAQRDSPEAQVLAGQRRTHERRPPRSRRGTRDAGPGSLRRPAGFGRRGSKRPGVGAGSRSAKLGAGRAHAARGEAGSQAAPDVGLVTARAVARPGRSHRMPFTAPAQGESGVGAAGQQSRDAPWDAGGPGTPHHTHGSPDATAGSPGMSAEKRGGERTGRPRHVPGPAGHPRGPDPQPHALGLAGWPSLQPSPAAQPSPA